MMAKGIPPAEDIGADLGCSAEPIIAPLDVELIKEPALSSSKRVPASTPAINLPFVVRTTAPGPQSHILSCPACHSPLNLIQPDEYDPARLLGICESCTKWALLVELEPEWQKVLVVDLPDGPTLISSYRNAETRAQGRGADR
jgi:hypothetical protein